MPVAHRAYDMQNPFNVGLFARVPHTAFQSQTGHFKHQRKQFKPSTLLQSKDAP